MTDQEIIEVKNKRQKTASCAWCSKEVPLASEIQRKYLVDCGSEECRKELDDYKSWLRRMK